MQGFNMGRYVPPELEGVLSFNQASNKKPTSRKPDGSQTVRFECPFAIWCTTCEPEQIIGQGVRFNANKQRVGSYYSTPIWSFKFKHNVCGGWIDVQTDPRNTEYVVVSGGRRRDTGDNKILEGEILIGRTEEEKTKLEKDGSFGLLEKTVKDKEIANTQAVRIQELKKRQERDWADPYELNKRIRKGFRVGRRQRQTDQKTTEALQEKFGLGVDLIESTAEDGERAKLTDFGAAEEESTAARGIFEKKSFTVARPAQNDRGNREEKTHLIPEQKSVLRKTLRGNTRARDDPFVTSAKAWQPVTRRKRETGPEEAEPVTTEKNKEGQYTTTSTATLVAYDSD